VVTVNRTRKDSCENAHVCYCLLIGIYGVQSCAVNASCTLGQTRATASMYNNSVSKASKQHAWNYFTQTQTIAS